MNYQKIYDRLIGRATHRLLEGYCENHHIVPRCMSGTDKKENLVLLTPEEHYVAHQLLVKIYPNNHSLVKAVQMMVPNRPSNKLYGWIRRRHSAVMSIQQGGKNNSQYGTRWIHCIDLKKSKKILKITPLPESWKEGRKINFDILYCIECGNEIIISSKRYCSDQCRTYHKAPHFKIIDDSYEIAKTLFEQYGSVARVLKGLGLESGYVGNTYLSNKLKESGYTILRRRNSPIS